MAMKSMAWVSTLLDRWRNFLERLPNHPQVQTLLAWWKTLSLREKRLISLLGAITLAVLVFWPILAFFSHQSQVSRTLEAKHIELTQARRLAQELDQLTQAPNSGPAIPGGTPTQFLENLAQRLGAFDRLQITPLAMGTPNGPLEVRLEELSLDEMAFFLFSVQDANAPLTLDQVEIHPSLRTAETLRLLLRVKPKGGP